MNIYLATKNNGKVMAAQSAFDGTNITLLPVTREYPEIQADTSAEIARFTALAVARDHNAPAIREDHSLCVNALGIPGPYMNFFSRRVSAATLLEILSHFKDRSGYFEIAATYAEPDGATREFTFQVPCTFATEERGTLQEGWDRIIMLEGESRTLAEYPETERLNVWNKNFLAMRDMLEKSKISL